MESPEIKRALISVSNKLGLVDFARGLVDAGVEIYSTGGTRRHLQQHDIPVVDVSLYTGFPEMMDGRVKTLHPKIFAGILARRNNASDMQSLAEHEIVPFELVVVNLYPFEMTIARPNVLMSEAVEQIDIGGPSLVRAAAKNSDFVTVVTHPEQYWHVLEELTREGRTSSQTRRQLMQKAFQHTANYDMAIAHYFSGQTEGEVFPSTLQLSLSRRSQLRYGENSHQAAALYSVDRIRDASLVNARQLNGKPLSYNNFLDLDAALSMVRGLSEPATSVIKHNNPCGSAVASSLSDATRLAMQGDPLSAFGSVLAMNREVDLETAEFLATGEFFIEAIVAPDFAPQALACLTSKPKWKKNVRLMKVGPLASAQPYWEVRQLVGGMLVQEADIEPDDVSQWNVVVGDVDDGVMEELAFGWHMVRFVKSNAITLSKNRALVGVGAGQMSRVDSVEIAIRKAGPRATGSVLASDAFFPFPDSVERAAEAGVAAIIQPGGSVNDAAVIEAAEKAGIPMVMTGRRHFRH